MWSNVINEGHDPIWVVEALNNGMTVWVTDGSYIKEVAPLISGTSWILYCTATKLRLCGSFAEKSPFAGPYRRELLGLLAIHILCAALGAFYSIQNANGKICCDNQGALFKSKQVRR